MNDHDFNNLKFILTSSEEVVADWFLKTSADDIEYAMELLQVARIEMSFIISEISDDCTEANTFLKKFML